MITTSYTPTGQEWAAFLTNYPSIRVTGYTSEAAAVFALCQALGLVVSAK